MKKSELTVGMQVETSYGRVGTVIDMSGWRKDPHPYSTNLATVEWEGQRLQVTGYRDSSAPGVLVLWGSASWPTIEQARRLFPSGTYRAMRAAEDAESVREQEWQASIAKDLLGQVAAAWGDHDRWLLKQAGVDPDATVLDDDEKRAIKLILLCGRVHAGEVEVR